jgi:dienelactone hydrolase|tara:strand:+ start:10303 stop:11208 length:906 start_codon:yes stop_codon:yes gene_type:complete
LINPHSTALTLLLIVALAGCSNTNTSSDDSRQDLEAVADDGDLSAFFLAAKNNARAEITTIEAINAVLRPYDRIYRPAGDGPFPAMLFFHGCSGATIAHEEDWASFYNDIGVVLIAVDSYTGRDIDWEDTCNFTKMTPWERAGDVLATVAYARKLDFVDANHLGVTGFSHGAATVWTTLVYASTKTPPINLQKWPEDGLAGVQLALPFYGGCSERWTVPIPTISFLAGNDRYIDATTCERYDAANPDMNKYASYKIFEDATHTFDHSKPNQSNIDAGSRYDAEATLTSQGMISTAINQVMR